MNNLQGLGPISYPIHNPNPNPRPNTDPKSVSFDEVSKLFNLPLSDAAQSLGVCASVLKKICYENGLVRWPYRKVISGKSIEDIKKEALREKQERSVEFPKAAGERNDSLASSAILSFSNQDFRTQYEMEIHTVETSQDVLFFTTKISPASHLYHSTLKL
ncbi:hypothetical protein T459_23731 [Capsicum annuum]|uniref:RWP-RK domain-containing protein n=1 Tax=Capsicum annuum TaxID=4072 RepID=A0A2G2YT72_CAPAN|nr:hypothetical protein T459_23731 [Capsicum annuum]